MAFVTHSGFPQRARQRNRGSARASPAPSKSPRPRRRRRAPRFPAAPRPAAGFAAWSTRRPPAGAPRASVAAAMARSSSPSGIDELVDQAARRPLRRRIGRGAENHVLEMLRRRGATHDLHGDRRKRHADEQLGHPDPAGVTHHQPPVGGTREHAASGDGMPVDCRHHRLRVREIRSRASCSAPAETCGYRARRHRADAAGRRRRRKSSGSGHDHGARGRQPDLLEALGQRFAEFDAHGVGLAVGHRRTATSSRSVSSITLPAPHRALQRQAAHRCERLPGAAPGAPHARPRSPAPRSPWPGAPSARAIGVWWISVTMPSAA